MLSCRIAGDGLLPVTKDLEEGVVQGIIGSDALCRIHLGALLKKVGE